MNDRHFFWLLASLLCGCCRVSSVQPAALSKAIPNEAGQSSGCDFLAPVRSPATDYDSGRARQAAVVSATLLSHVHGQTSEEPLADEIFLLMLRESPYLHEDAVYILRGAPGPQPLKFKVVHVRARASLVLMDVRDPSVGADITEAPIDPEIIAEVEKAWGEMTLRARWPDRETAIKRLKFGGTIFTFDFNGDNVYGQGTIVSPGKGTCTAGLVEIGDLMARFADESDDAARKELGKQLLSTSRQLAERL